MTVRMRSVLFLILSFSVSALAQSDFSAEIVSPKNPSPFPTRIFVTKNKLRFQQQDRGGRASSIMLVDLAALTSVVLIPQQHLYVKQSRPQIPGQGVAFFQPANPATACRPWQKMAELQGKCRNLGTEMANGRETVKYENIATDKSTSYIWIDTKLDFPVKWEGPVGPRELREIQVAPQPKDLFEIPTGYTKRNLSPNTAKSAQ